jgi:DNA-binding transcriptional LysR family regulator
MVNPTLKQLRYFEALARHGQFGRAHRGQHGLPAARG